LCPAIAWKKKAYRSKFDYEKNYVEFTQLTTRMLNAHTQPLACDLQEEILKWLKDVKEVRAHRWFEKYWMDPTGTTPMRPPVFVALIQFRASNHGGVT
jgi:hypothetical protein